MSLQSYKDKSSHPILWNFWRAKREKIRASRITYHLNYCVILGSRSRKLGKATISFVMSVRLSAWTLNDFYEI
jgi:hypothetical protein